MMRIMRQVWTGGGARLARPHKVAAWKIEKMVDAIDGMAMTKAITIMDGMLKQHPIQDDDVSMVRRMLMVNICKACVLSMAIEDIERKVPYAWAVNELLTERYEGEFIQVMRLVQSLAPDLNILQHEHDAACSYPLSFYQDALPGLEPGMLTYQLHRWFYPSHKEAELAPHVYRLVASIAPGLDHKVSNFIREYLDVGAIAKQA